MEQSWGIGDNMNPIYMIHPQHGTHPFESTDSAEKARKAGWVEVKQAPPVVRTQNKDKKRGWVEVDVQETES